VAETSCPAPGELSGFVLGTLPEADLQRIARHLDVCAACEAAVRTLENLGDPVLTAIRDALNASTSNEPGVNPPSLRKESSQKALQKESRADRRRAP
jgi:anti-sigma factor RsiW